MMGVHRRLRGRHYATSELIDVVCDGGAIQDVGAPSLDRPDAEAGWIAPGFFDLQINGSGGTSFSSGSLTSAEIAAVTATCRRHGVTQFLPTLITNDHESLAQGMRQIHHACDASPTISSAIAGIHLEGPYISPEDGLRGAHPRQHVRLPDWDEFRKLQDAAEGMIRLVTLAPELDGALPFIERLSGAGIIAAIGHTAANPKTIRDAVRVGARLSTHLGNGTHALLPRHDNYVWEQLGNDSLWASLICDGHHLPPAMVRCMIRAKTPARTILTCDASSLAGLPPGQYREWDQDLEIRPEGKIVVKGTSYLAGSWSFTDVCVSNAIRFGGVTLAEAVDMACACPRELLGLPQRRIEPGMPADLALFDWQEGHELKLRTVVAEGEPLF